MQNEMLHLSFLHSATSTRSEQKDFIDLFIFLLVNPNLKHLIHTGNSASQETALKQNCKRNQTTEVWINKFLTQYLLGDHTGVNG